MSDNTRLAIETTVISGANKTTAGGAATTLYGWVAQSDLISIMGLALAVLGFLVSIYFQVRRERREIELHKAKLTAISNRNMNET